MARHHRQRGEDVFFLTGTDEHGEPVADAAKAQGLEPKELADRNAERFQALMPRLEGLQRLLHPHLRPASTSAACRRCSSASTTTATSTRACTRAGTARAARTSRSRTRSAEGNRCPIHEIELVREQEENWFFRLSTFQEQLERLYAEQPDFVMPRERFNEAQAFINSGLQDVSLSRAAG